jgi:hypothetical protein
MVCVEAANAGDDRMIVAPLGEHRLATTLSVNGRSSSVASSQR